MNTKALLAIILALSVLVSCKKLKKLADIRFSVPYSKSVAVQGLPDNPVVPPLVGLKASIPPIGMPTNSEEYIRKYNTSSTLITSVQLAMLKLDITEPQSQTFDIADSLWVYLSSPGLPEILAAHYFDIPKDTRTLDLVTSDANLKEYFLKDSMYFRMEGHFYKAPDSASVFTISTRFDAVANPLNKE